MSDRVEIVNGDSLLVLQLLDDNSVDAIVTDPPYGLSFMGKKWDYDVPSDELWRQCFRVLKAGGHLLCFAGTRTQHRMAVRIEDAGFEIRDMIAWVYGSGFPKSLDVSKAIDKNNGEVGRLLRFTEWMRTTGLTSKQIDQATGTNMGGHYLTAKSQPAIPTRKLWDKLRPLCGQVPEWVDELVERIEAEREVVGQHKTDMGGLGGERLGQAGGNITAPATDAAKQWQGWGTALKPALEPITVARKPLIGTVAENVLQHGTGAINVDDCRVGAGEKISGGGSGRIGNFAGKAQSNSNLSSHRQESHDKGRWPANFIHDGSEEVVELFPMTKSGKIWPHHKRTTDGSPNGIYGKFDVNHQMSESYGDSGSAARFFYCAKASKADRDTGCEGLEERLAMRYSKKAQGPLPKQTPSKPVAQRNHHPTVKPTDLMRYLCRLVTPPNGIVLDPFMGSGSTGKAAVLEGFRFIGIEREEEYCEIAKARIKHVCND